MSSQTSVMTADAEQAAAIIQSGGLLIYPTEAVYGLGCDYRNTEAVQRLLEVKQRPVEKGLILVASHVQQILPLIAPLHGDHLTRALKTWPGPNTWVFPATDAVSPWVRGSHTSVAVRVSAHPAVCQLCDALGHAIVSTSANQAGSPTHHDLQQIQAEFDNSVDCYLNLPLGSESRPSRIRNAADGTTLR